MADTRLIYLAGFFDGEGSVGMYEGGRNVASLTNTDIRPLIMARDLFGGYLTMQPIRSRPGAVQDLFRWQIYGHSARPFLEAIRPFVMLKGEQIDVYLDALAHVPVGRGTRRKPGDTEALGVAASRLRSLKRGA